MKYVRKTSGDKSTDKVFEDVYRILETLNITQSGTSSINNSFKFTEIGGYAIRVVNKYGAKLSHGYLARVFESSTENYVTLCREDEYDCIGIIYGEIPVDGIGYIVISGPADVYFNANGASARDLFGMSRINSTVNTDHGKAQAWSITKPDTIRILGSVLAPVIGEGLARCVLKK